MTPQTISTLAILVSLPFQVIGQIITFVGTYRDEHMETNLFHRAFAFCDSSKAGKVILALLVSSTSVFVFFGIMLVFPNSVIDALFYSSMPWALFPVWALVELKVERKYPSAR